MGKEKGNCCDLEDQLEWMEMCLVIQRMMASVHHLKSVQERRTIQAGKDYTCWQSGDFTIGRPHILGKSKFVPDCQVSVKYHKHVPAYLRSSSGLSKLPPYALIALLKSSASLLGSDGDDCFLIPPSSILRRAVRGNTPDCKPGLTHQCLTTKPIGT